MASDIEQNVREEIQQLLKNINAAWVKGRSEDLEEYFHEDMVIFDPGFGRRGIGKKACVESYKDFTSHATIHEFTESDPAIDIWGDTAVAIYKFEINYKTNGEDHRDFGQDLFVFIRERGKWRAVWRVIIPLPGGG